MRRVDLGRQRLAQGVDGGHFVGPLLGLGLRSARLSGALFQLCCSQFGFAGGQRAFFPGLVAAAFGHPGFGAQLVQVGFAHVVLLVQFFAAHQLALRQFT